MTDLSMFSKIEADRILKRAAEIEGSDEVGPVTVDELRSIASEAGFGAAAIERAIAEAQAASVVAERHVVRKSGLVVRRFSTSRSVPVEISSDQLMRAVRMFQPYRDGPAQVRLGVNEITWRDRKGLQFRVISSGGVTEVQVFVSKILIRKRWSRWIQAAADSLESMILLIAARDLPSSRSARLKVGAGETVQQRRVAAGARE